MIRMFYSDSLVIHTTIQRTMQKLQSELRLLEWTKGLLDLQARDALEEVKDWQQLRVSNHLRQIINGTALSEEKALTNSLDKLSIAEDIQKSQLLAYERESERIANQIKTKEAENQVLEVQIEDAKEGIKKSQKEYAAFSEVRLSDCLIILII
jgi:hypothetical protein